MTFISNSPGINLNSTAVSPWSGIPADEYLARLDARFADVVFPATFFLGVLMVAGAVGNAAVLYVYTCRVRGQGGTVTRFIQALAVFDLLSCCLAIPGEIMDMQNNYTFGRSPLCKMVRTVNLFCTLTSGITLIVVAIDRYKRICCPLKTQISPRGAAVIVCVASVMALILSTPTAVIYGSRSVVTDHPLAVGMDCSIRDRYVETVIPLVYNGIQLLLFTIGFVILLVLYVFIARRIWQHAHQRLQRRRSTIIGLRQGHRFPTSPSDAASSSPPTTELASPITLTPEEQKEKQSGRNLFFNSIRGLESGKDEHTLLQKSVDVEDIPDTPVDPSSNSKTVKGVDQVEKVKISEIHHRRCSSDPLNTGGLHTSGLDTGGQNTGDLPLTIFDSHDHQTHPDPIEERSPWSPSFPVRLAGSRREGETCDRDSGIGADSSPPNSADPDNVNVFDRLPRASGTENAPPLAHTSGERRVVGHPGECTAGMEATPCVENMATLSLSSESRPKKTKRNSLPSAMYDGTSKTTGVPQGFASVQDIITVPLMTQPPPHLPKSEVGSECNIISGKSKKEVLLAQGSYESSAPDIPLLKPFVEAEEEGSKRDTDRDPKRYCDQQIQGYGLGRSGEGRDPRAVGSCGDLASRKPRDPRCHKRTGSSAASIARSEGDHVTVCSITLSEDEGETEEEILGDTRDGGSAYTASPESAPESGSCQKCSHKQSISSRRSLRARLANSTTNLLARLVSNEKSVSEWDATLDISDVEMDTLRRGAGKQHSSRRRLKSTETRRASGSHHVEFSKPGKSLAIALTLPPDAGADPDEVFGCQDSQSLSGKADEGVKSLNNGGDSSHLVTDSTGRLSDSEVLQTKSDPPQPVSEDEERLEKKVIFRNSSIGTGDNQERSHRLDDGGSQVQSDEATEDKETSQDGEGKVSLRSRRRGSSFRGLKDLKFRRFTLKSDTPGIRRTTLILFLISLVYIVSFLPHLVMMTVKALRPQAVAGDSDTWTVASNLIIRSYFLNSVANPFIYTFLSKNFVRRVRGSFSRWSRVRGRAGNRV